MPAHARVVDRWSDGSARWVLLELALDADVTALELSTHAAGEAPAVPAFPTLQVAGEGQAVRVDTGTLQADLTPGLPFPLGRVRRSGAAVADEANSGLRVELARGGVVDFDIAAVTVRSASPLRAVVAVTGTARGSASCPVQVEARLEFFAGSPVVRIDTTLRNPSPSQHPGGCWVLGDGGSVLVRSAVYRVAPVGGIRRVRAQVDRARTIEGAPPFALHQESSGGPAWNSRVHCNSRGEVTLRYSGYTVEAQGQSQRGDRAEPIVTVDGQAGPLSVAVPRFWQRFPKGLSVDAGAIVCALFPADAAEPHELQGGEQTTQTCVVAFGEDPVCAPPLAWVHAPTVASVDPAWIAATGAVPFLTPQSAERWPEYTRLVETALDADSGFVAKRERADEYGWRNFGDLPADHESAHLPPGQVNISHYNNQYDALAAFAVHYLRTGDRRWFALMCDLASHVRDIDIYHTSGDKAAYNGGLFWHTDHYVDAGASTHRTYPAGSSGGGPSNEHNYNTGFLLHYLLTGDERSRDAAIGLGQWVLDMDEGSKTVFRWLAGGPTGLASATGSPTYHGPGRGAANSILACLVAHRLTGEARFAAKADELVRRCIHPADDLAARRLDDTERRWYYTVFLQALGEYLIDRQERRQFDAMFDYARASLLHYARYVADVEKPYLDTPERLEYPTETWVAQDFRKGDALLWAAYFATDASEQRRFLAAADRFFDYAAPTLLGMPTHTYTRPLVLALGTAWHRPWFATHALPAPAPAAFVPPPMPPAFEPQKQVALRRARWVAALGGVALLAVLAAGIRLLLLTAIP